MMSKFIIIGLGNIGWCFNKTPHNIGFALVDSIADKYNIEPKFIKKYHGSYGEKTITVNDVRVSLGIFLPHTMMNSSGIAVKEISKLTKIDRILVCTDNWDLSVGENKIKVSGNSTGHNGINSINNCLNTTKYSRLRVGTGNTKVLNSMSDSDIRVCIDSSSAMVEDWLLAKAGRK